MLTPTVLSMNCSNFDLMRNKNGLYASLSLRHVPNLTLTLCVLKIVHGSPGSPNVVIYTFFLLYLQV